MTKTEMLKQLESLCKQKNMRVSDINVNSNKTDIQTAIDCLACSDEEMNDYLTVIKLKYNNIYKAILTNSDYRTHQFNRLYVYRTAKMTLMD